MSINFAMYAKMFNFKFETTTCFRLDKSVFNYQSPGVMDTIRMLHRHNLHLR